MHEWKNDYNSIIFGAKIKVRRNLIWEKLMQFLLFNEVLKNLISFQLPITKVGFMMLTLSKFQILNANLWSIYSRKFEFMVYTFICAFFYWCLRPSKSSGFLKKSPNFGFLTILKLKLNFHKQDIIDFTKFSNRTTLHLVFASQMQLLTTWPHLLGNDELKKIGRNFRK